MADYTFDDIREAAEKRYKGLKIELPGGSQVELRNILRLPSELRAKIAEMQDGEDDRTMDEQFNTMREMILMLADNEHGGQALLDLVGNDDAVLVQLIRTWQEQTQVGEAESSKS